MDRREVAVAGNVGDRAGWGGGGSDGRDACGTSREGVQALGALIFTSAGGGVGVSTLAALCARLLAADRTRTALVDCSGGGGLDVLLGIEGEEGMRMGQVEAPLGRLDPEALDRELPTWDGVGVLSSDPWKEGAADWWNVDAAVRALAIARDLLVVDGGRGEDVSGLPSLSASPWVLVVEMSVLGLARASHLMDRFRLMETGGGGVGRRGFQPRLQGPGDGGSGWEEGPGWVEGPGGGEGSGQSEWIGPGREAIFVGMDPRLVPPSQAVDVQEACDFLGVDICAVFRPHRTLARSALAGLGIEGLPRSYRRGLDDLCACIARVMDLDRPRRHG